MKRDPRRVSFAVLTVVLCLAVISPLVYSGYNLELAVGHPIRRMRRLSMH